MRGSGEMIWLAITCLGGGVLFLIVAFFSIRERYCKDDKPHKWSKHKLGRHCYYCGLTKREFLKRRIK